MHDALSVGSSVSKVTGEQRRVDEAKEARCEAQNEEQCAARQGERRQVAHEELLGEEHLR